MKRSAVVLALILGGCGSAPQPYMTKDYALGDTRSAQTGAVMVSWEDGQRESEKGPVVEGRKRELIYNGTSDSTVYVGYREYFLTKDATPRAAAVPAYSSELRYSLKGSRVIVYQDLRLNVEEVLPGSIRFTVAGDFKPPVSASAEQPEKKVQEPPEAFPK